MSEIPGSLNDPLRGLSEQETIDWMIEHSGMEGLKDKAKFEIVYREIPRVCVEAHMKAHIEITPYNHEDFKRYGINSPEEKLHWDVEFESW